jgi:hypothetical protein
MGEGQMKSSLKPHPSTNALDIYISFRLLWLTPSVMMIYFVVGGEDYPLIRFADRRWERERKDELWRTTCFELFLRDPENSEYFEYHMSPSCDSACYRFDDYRDGMQPMMGSIPPMVHPDHQDLSCYTCWCYIAVPPHIRKKALIAGFNAVIETKDGQLSYWALDHPPTQPDFHHRDCFALSLPAPAGE